MLAGPTEEPDTAIELGPVRMDSQYVSNTVRCCWVHSRDGRWAGHWPEQEAEDWRV